VRAVVVTPPAVVNFADVAERVNPAVVNIDSSSRAREGIRRQRPTPRRRPDGDSFGPPPELDPDRGSGSGFIIDSAGHILTNHHVIDGAERITVKLADGRSFRASVVGADPPTDIALIKIAATERLPSAPLGDSSTLRVGEWVCAIGNPLAYEHTVTVGVVSFIGRKLFDASLDHYIQTDAAINFGNSGGPLINSRGEVIGINSAISWRASNIGFAVPINQAREILPQLKADGRVSRGYIGITLKDLDPDLRESLELGDANGALVLEVADGSPGDRAGIRTYDLILSVDGEAVTSNDELIREIAARPPGSVARLQVLRDRQERTVQVKLAERRRAENDPEDARAAPRRPVSSRPADRLPLGLTVIGMDDEAAMRYGIRDRSRGVIVSNVEPMSPADEASFERGFVVLEINRTPVSSVRDYQRIVMAARPGDVLAFYLYVPSANQRALRTVRVDSR
jgi:serine protease Do